MLSMPRNSTPGSARMRASRSPWASARRKHVRQDGGCPRHHTDREPPRLVEADRLRRETDDGFSEQGRAGEQHHGQRDLTGDDERAANGCGIGPGLAPIAARRSRGIEEPVSDGAAPQRIVIADADDHCEHQHARINRNQVNARQARRCERSRGRA